MADFDIDQAGIVAFPLAYPDGSPVTSGIGGTVPIYGPTSATVAYATPTVVNYGGGIYGAPVSAWGVPGLYTAIPSLTGLPTDVVAPRYQFTVGTVEAWQSRLVEVLIDLAQLLGDGAQGIATGGSTSTLTDPQWAYGADGDWLGSELLLLGPAQFANLAGLANPDLRRVSNFVASGGTFTFTPNATAAVSAGQPYLLSNVNGKAYSHQRKLAALRNAWRIAAPTIYGSDQVSLLSAFNSDEYALPQRFTTIERVFRQPTVATNTSRWEEIAMHYCEVRPDRRLLVLDPCLGMDQQYWRIRVEGQFPAPFPQHLGARVEVPAAWLIARARYELLIASKDAADRQAAGAFLGELSRMGIPRRRRMLPGGVRLG